MLAQIGPTDPNCPEPCGQIQVLPMQADESHKQPDRKHFTTER